MTFRTIGLGKSYDLAQNTASSMKQFSTSSRDTLLAGAVSGDHVVHLMKTMASYIQKLDSVSSEPGIVEFAKDQENDPLYDIAAEFTAIRAAAIAVRDWVFNNFPKSAGGFIEKDTLEANGNITVSTWTTAETAGLQSLLATLIATIE